MIDYYHIYKLCMDKVRKLFICYLILRKIVKIVATRRQILRQKCTKFDFDWGSPDPDGELTALSQSP